MKRGVAIIGILLVLCICFCGCSEVGEEYFVYLEKGFCAEVEGMMNGQAISAVVSLEAQKGGYLAEVRYLSPSTLKGLAVCGECDAKGVPFGVGRLSWEGCESEADAHTVTGLLLPARAFLPSGELATVRREDTGYSLTLTDGTALSVGEEGGPRWIKDESIELEIKWLEWIDDSDLAKE